MYVWIHRFTFKLTSFCDISSHFIHSIYKTISSVADRLPVCVIVFDCHVVFSLAKKNHNRSFGILKCLQNQNSDFFMHLGNIFKTYMSNEYVSCFYDGKMTHTCGCSVCLGGVWDTAKWLPKHWLGVMNGQQGKTNCWMELIVPFLSTFLEKILV